MRNVLTALSLLAAPSLAFAQTPDQPPPAGEPAPPPPAGPPMVMQPMPNLAPVANPVEAGQGNGPADGWQLQARIPTGLGIDTILSSGFTVAHRAGGFAIGAEVGVIGGKFSTDNGGGSTNSESVLLFTIMPVIYSDLWQSKDGRARFNFIAGAGYARGSLTNDTNDGMGGTTSTDSTVSYIPLLAGIGGDYYFSPNFGLGVELSGEVPILISAESNGMDAHVSGNLESLHGLIRATFIVGP